MEITLWAYSKQRNIHSRISTISPTEQGETVAFEPWLAPLPPPLPPPPCSMLWKLSDGHEQPRSWRLPFSHMSVWDMVSPWEVSYDQWLQGIFFPVFLLLTCRCLYLIIYSNNLSFNYSVIGILCVSSLLYSTLFIFCTNWMFLNIISIPLYLQVHIYYVLVITLEFATFIFNVCL